MKPWAIYLSITIIIVLCYFLFNKLKKDFIKSMSALLYAEQNADGYLAKLDSFEGRFFLTKKTRIFRRIDGYAIKGDQNAMIETFKELENMKLSFGQQVALYEKEVSFYVENGLFDEAVKANEQMQQLNQQAEFEDLQKVALNCDALVRIYVKKDGSLANEMVQAGDESTMNTVKGSYYYRAAKCYYYRKDNKMVDKYLKKALTCLNKTSWADFLEACLEDHSKIEER